MNEWKLEIKKVENGYILKGRFGDNDEITEAVVAPADGDEYTVDNGYGSNLTMMQTVLYEVMEYFAVFNSRHNENNLEINIINEKKDENLPEIGVDPEKMGHLKKGTQLRKEPRKKYEDYTDSDNFLND